MEYYPVFLDLRRRPCVVIGGGEVAERKVAGLAAAGADVTVVSPHCTPELLRRVAQGEVRWVERVYREGDLAGAWLAVASTDDVEVHEAVAREAESYGVILNVVDVTRLCTFIAPSIIRRGDVTLAISTGGLSPALAKKLRLELEKSSALRYAELAELMAGVRGQLHREGAEVAPERWQTALDQEVLDLYVTGRHQEARERLLGALTGCAAPGEASVP